MIIKPYRFAGAGGFDGFGNASRDFDGTDDYLTMGDVLDETDGGPLSGSSTQFTIAAWVKATTSDAAGVIVGKFRDSSGNRQILFYFLPSGVVRFGWWAGSSVFQIEETTATPINASTWTHVAVEFDGTQADPDDCVTIYIDGASATLDATPITGGTPTSTIVNRNTALQIGAALNSGGTDTFRVDGLIADVRIYDALIGSTAIDGLSNGTDYQTNLVGWWLIDTDDLTDHSTNSNNASEGASPSATTYSTDGPAD